MARGVKFPMAVEVQIVAMLARGDTPAHILEIMARLGYTMNQDTVHEIRKRNKAAMELIKKSLFQYEEASSRDILKKAQRLINRQLKNVEQTLDDNDKLEADLKAGTIEVDEYAKRKKTIKMPTLAELTAVSKEFFHEHQLETGKPTAITEGPLTPEEKQAHLKEIFNESDEVELQRVIFRNVATETPDAQPRQTIPASQGQ